MTEPHPIVSHEAWLEARKQFLRVEKEFTQAREQLSAQRRALPWERVEKSYVFETANGPRSLGDLFEGKSQLVVYHFMYGPLDTSKPCSHCSFWADNFNGIQAHLTQRDVNMVAVSRAPLAKLQAFAKRMSWSFPWCSSGSSDFNFDYGVSWATADAERNAYNYGTTKTGSTEMPGISVFYRSAASAEVFHTYSTYARGIDMLNTVHHYLDLLPKGRDEAGLSNPMAWVKLHDEY